MAETEWRTMIEGQEKVMMWINRFVRRHIGGVRRFFLMPFACKWNAWVRDATANMSYKARNARR